MNYNSGYGGQPPKKKHSNSGFIVPNDRKRTANDPDMSGTFTIGDDVVAYIMSGGREFWVSGWNKQAMNPKTRIMGPLLSLGMKPKVARPAGGQGGYGAQPIAPQAPQGAWNPAPQAPWGAPAPSAPAPQQHFSAGTPAMYPQPQAPAPQWGGQPQAPQHPGNGFPNDEIPF